MTHDESAAAARARRLEERAIAAGLTTDAELDEILTRVYAKGSPAAGARIVAHAWTDSAFKERLMADGNEAAAELGFTTRGYRLKVVENTERRHNVIVCTLCSCYPVSLLGPSPSWYKSLAYRSRVVREPREVLGEFGMALPADVEISVWDASAESRYMVLPQRPEADGIMAERALAVLVTRNGLIGTAAM